MTTTGRKLLLYQPVQSQKKSWRSSFSTHRKNDGAIFATKKGHIILRKAFHQQQRLGHQGITCTHKEKISVRVSSSYEDMHKKQAKESNLSEIMILYGPYPSCNHLQQFDPLSSSVMATLTSSLCIK